MSTAQSQSPWQLTFIDGFDQGQLDTSKWSIGYGWGRTSEGRREEVRDQNVSVSNNQLVLTIDHDGGDGYYSGAVNTRNKFSQKYGFWEAAIRPPRDLDGLLPAFWTKPNDESWPPELDVVEWVGGPRSSVHNSHYTNDSGNKDNWEASYTADTDLSAGYHIYGMHWTPSDVTWYVDGYRVGSTSAGVGNGEGQLNSAPPFYTMFSCHIWEQEWLGNPDNLSGWPYEMRIDWVRCWQDTRLD